MWHAAASSRVITGESPTAARGGGAPVGTEIATLAPFELDELQLVCMWIKVSSLRFSLLVDNTDARRCSGAPYSDALYL